MNIYQISSYIYSNTGSAIDTEVVDGICPDDTIEVSNRDGEEDYDTLDEICEYARKEL